LKRSTHGSPLRGRRIILLGISILSILLLSSVIWTPGIRTSSAQEVNVEIVGVYTTDSNGTNKTTFSRGQTVIVWVAVRNLGSDLDLSPLGPIIWIEVDDPRIAPLTVQYHIGVLPGGGRVKREGFSVFLGYSPGFIEIPLGKYSASGFVSDKMISQGGSFFVPQVTITFNVTT